MARPKESPIQAQDLFDDRLAQSYGLLRRVAQKHLDRNAHLTVSATELVHEFYLRVGEKGLEYHNTDHFISLASQCMRWMLLDYAKAKRRVKRGSGGASVEFDENLHTLSTAESSSQLVDAMERLGAESPRAAQVAELRYLVGLEISETAELLKISEATVKREWAFAKEWLAKELFRNE